jgi:hypothetical protein
MQPRAGGPFGLNFLLEDLWFRLDASLLALSPGPNYLILSASLVLSVKAQYTFQSELV